MTNPVEQFFVKKIYADHNSSATVQHALRMLVDGLVEGDEGLNIGAGFTRLSPQVSNMELVAGDGIDIVGSVEDIPTKDNRFALIVTQEVLEHVENPFLALQEIARVLKPGGKAYIQLPFIIGYHPCPKDYWRFTHEGIVQLATHSGLQCIETGVSVGSATGFYRILVEFLAILFSLPLKSSYRGFKAMFSLFCYPIKWLDRLLALSPQAHRIAGGYFVILTK